jgi:transposase
MLKDSANNDVAAEVMRLHYIEGLALRAISRRLGLARNTVRRILGRRVHKPARASAPRGSLLDRFQDVIQKLFDETPEITAPATLERLRPLGYTGGVSIVRDRLRKLRGTTKAPAFVTLDFAPGEALQVDWADFGFALPGCPRRVSAFVATLAYSRYLYLEFVLSQSMGSFLRCMDRALLFFQGVTHTDVFDNMKTVVLERTRSAVRFNPRFVEYARARGQFAITACNPRSPHEKGRIERPIGFVRSRFWPGRRFEDLTDLQDQATYWRDLFANGRVHEVTGKVPALVFRHEEKPKLKSIANTTFDTDDLLGTTVTKTFRVRFDRNTYSVPSRLVSQNVLVRADDQSVRVFLGPKQVALHTRSWEAGKDLEHPSHKRSVLETKVRASADRLPEYLSGLGETGVRYFKLLGAGGRSIQRETIRITLLVELFGEQHTRSAIDDVMSTGHLGSEYIEYVLRYRRGIQPAAEPLRLGDPELDGICLHEPDMSVYDELFARPKTLDPGAPLPDPEQGDCT